MPSTHYETLGVTKDASAADIRKAYRAAALRWHPDKNPENREEAEQRFVAIAAAHEVLSDEQARAAYDRGGDALVHRSRTGGDPFGGFDFARASQMFHENFGGAIAAQWRPGMKVSGMLVRNGKRVTITIHPDGTSDETEETAGSSAAYSYVSSSGGAGGTGTHIQITGSLGQAFADAVLPQTMQRMPTVGPALSTGLSWVPCIACVGCCYICCCRSAAPPGVGNPGLHKYQ
jgi:DnaJ-class molecular chaperone